MKKSRQRRGRCTSAPPHPRVKVAHPDILHKDVLLGRGGYVHTHSGNLVLRRLIQEQYLATWKKLTSRKGKTKFAWQIVMDVRYQGFRFLKGDDTEGDWYIVEDEVAREKIVTILRELTRKKVPCGPPTSGSSNQKLKKKEADAKGEESDPGRRPSDPKADDRVLARFRDEELEPLPFNYGPRPIAATSSSVPVPTAVAVAKDDAGDIVAAPKSGSRPPPRTCRCPECLFASGFRVEDELEVEWDDNGSIMDDDEPAMQL